MMNCSRILTRRVTTTLPLQAYKSVAGQSFSALVSIEDEFPGLPTLTPQPSKATTISVSTLPNGLKVITEDAGTSSTVTLTYPKAGSSNEMIHEQGAAFVNKHMNFRSGSGISTLVIQRTIEDEGGFPITTVDRYGATMGFTVAPEKALGLIPLLATDCSFEKWDVRDAKEEAMKESDLANESAQIVLTENLHAAAYGPQSPAGRPLYGMTCSTDALKAFRMRTYGLNGAILAATGVKDHAAFCTEAANLLSESPVGNADAVAPIAYLGGESRVSAPSTGYAHIALGFVGPESSVISDIVVQYLSLAGMEAGVSGYATKGLVGVYAGSESTKSMIDSMVATIKGSPSPALIHRAKHLAKAEALFALDGGSKSMAGVLTASVLNSTVVTSAAEVASVYDAVTDKQVTDALSAMLKCNPSLAAVGDISLVPYQATVAAMLK